MDVTEQLRRSSLTPSQRGYATKLVNRGASARELNRYLRKHHVTEYRIRKIGHVRRVQALARAIDHFSELIGRPPTYSSVWSDAYSRHVLGLNERDIREEASVQVGSVRVDGTLVNPLWYRRRG